jgi:hypothetical protein
MSSYLPPKWSIRAPLRMTTTFGSLPPCKQPKARGVHLESETGPNQIANYGHLLDERDIFFVEKRQDPPFKNYGIERTVLILSNSTMARYVQAKREVEPQVARQTHVRDPTVTGEARNTFMVEPPGNSHRCA